MAGVTEKIMLALIGILILCAALAIIIPKTFTFLERKEEIESIEKDEDQTNDNQTSGDYRVLELSYIQQKNTFAKSFLILLRDFTLELFLFYKIK